MFAKDSKIGIAVRILQQLVVSIDHCQVDLDAFTDAGIFEALRNVNSVKNLTVFLTLNNDVWIAKAAMISLTY